MAPSARALRLFGDDHAFFLLHGLDLEPVLHPRLLAGFDGGGILADVQHDLLGDERADHRSVDPLAQILASKPGKRSAERRFAGHPGHGAQPAQAETLFQLLNQEARVRQVQDRFGQKGTGQGPAVDLFAAASPPLPRGRLNVFLDADDLQDLGNASQSRSQFALAFLLQQEEEFILDFLPVGSQQALPSWYNRFVGVRFGLVFHISLSASNANNFQRRDET